MILDSSLKVCFVMLEKILIFVMYYILTAGRLADYRQGFFIPVISIRRVSPPVWSVNAPTAVRCSTTGQVEPFFFLLQ